MERVSTILLIECYVQISLYRRCTKGFATFVEEIATSDKEIKSFVGRVAKSPSHRNRANITIKILCRRNLVKTH